MICFDYLIQIPNILFNYPEYLEYQIKEVFVLHYKQHNLLREQFQNLSRNVLPKDWIYFNYKSTYYNGKIKRLDTWTRGCIYLSGKCLFSRKSNSTIANVCLFVCHKAKPFNSLKSSSFIFHPSSFFIHPSFILHHSSLFFIHHSFISRLLSFSACLMINLK